MWKPQPTTTHQNSFNSGDIEDRVDLRNLESLSQQHSAPKAQVGWGGALYNMVDDMVTQGEGRKDEDIYLGAGG